MKLSAGTFRHACTALGTDEEHHKLSKRSRHSSFEDLVNGRASSISVNYVNYVALLGWNRRIIRRLRPAPRLVKVYSTKINNKSPAVLILPKAKMDERQYIRRMDDH